MQKVGNFFMSKDPKQAVVVERSSDENRELMDYGYQRRSSEGDETEEKKHVNFAKEVRSELEGSSKFCDKSFVIDLTRVFSELDFYFNKFYLDNSAPIISK